MESSGPRALRWVVGWYYPYPTKKEGLTMAREMKWNRRRKSKKEKVKRKKMLPKEKGLWNNEKKWILSKF